MICPKCRKRMLRGTRKGSYHCLSCGFDFVDDKPVELDPNNPYTDFAKEMSLLHEALKAEGFKDSMVDILAKMTPIVWDRVERKKAHERLKAAVKDLNKVEYEPPEWIKNLNEKNQKREDYNWDRIRKEVMGE